MIDEIDAIIDNSFKIEEAKNKCDTEKTSKIICILPNLIEMY